MSISDRIDAHLASGGEFQPYKNKNVCFCCLLYGSISDQLVSNLLALAHSLRGKGSLVLLLTPDVPDIFTQTDLFVKVKTVEYIYGSSSLFKKGWFQEVFTKFHVFNLVEYDRVLFLDLDTVVVDFEKLEGILNAPFRYGAMENSKGRAAPTDSLNHAQRFNQNCKLINAGVMLISPDHTLFNLLLSDVTSDSPDHVPGMTPEQFYLARVMGKHFHHISQAYNFEPQYHGGVPMTRFWNSAHFSDVVLFHFSGCSPLKQISEFVRYKEVEWGCQTQKYYAKKAWDTGFTEATKALANDRARLAFVHWAFHFSSACKHVRETLANNIPECIENLVRYGQERQNKSPLMVGDEDMDGNVLVMKLDDCGVYIDKDFKEFKVKFDLHPPKRPPPSLFS
jgi:lipopolysaccharide biosynthesis glycosyltransferase